MSFEWWLALVKEGGAYCAILELAALAWLNRDRIRILDENNELRTQIAAKHVEVKELAERVVTIATELKMFLFNERKT